MISFNTTSGMRRIVAHSGWIELVEYHNRILIYSIGSLYSRDRCPVALGTPYGQGPYIRWEDKLPDELHALAQSVNVLAEDGPWRQLVDWCVDHTADMSDAFREGFKRFLVEAFPEAD